MQKVLGLIENSLIATRQLSCLHSGTLLATTAAAAVEASASRPEKRFSVRMMIYTQNEGLKDEEQATVTTQRRTPKRSLPASKENSKRKSTNITTP